MKRIIGIFNNWFLFWLGIAVLCLVKVKHKIKGYSSPKPFDVSEVDRCIDYDIDTVDSWLDFLQKYVGEDSYLNGRKVLELGPGSDLGVGLILLAKGASEYNAVDSNNLVASVPGTFYATLFGRLGKQNDIDALVLELDKLRNGKAERLNYIARNDFDIVSALKKREVDLIFSQAAFEHFDDIDKTVSQMTQVSSYGAILIITIDLQTHSRGIRESDPNNIYRYPNWLYKLFYFPGIPNRIRPIDYKNTLEKYGWVDIVITPLTSLDAGALESIQPHLSTNYRNPSSDMDYLTILVCARRAK